MSQKQAKSDSRSRLLFPAQGPVQEVTEADAGLGEALGRERSSPAMWRTSLPSARSMRQVSQLSRHGEDEGKGAALPLHTLHCDTAPMGGQGLLHDIQTHAGVPGAVSGKCTVSALAQNISFLPGSLP
jgi:hypothetical protein